MTLKNYLKILGPFLFVAGLILYFTTKHSLYAIDLYNEAISTKIVSESLSHNLKFLIYGNWFTVIFFPVIIICLFLKTIHEVKTLEEKRRTLEILNKAEVILKARERDRQSQIDSDGDKTQDTNYASDTSNK